MMASDSEVVPPWSRGGGLTEHSFRWGLRRADVITVQHAEQLASVTRVFGRSAIEMPNVFEFSDAAHESEGIARSGALWVGRARRLKGPHHFLELARRMPQFQFTLVALPTETEPDFARQIEVQAATLSNVEFYPGLDPKELVSIYRRRSVLVNTSDYEGLPNTFIEAAANGLALASLRVDPGGMFSQERAGVAADGDMDRLTNLLSELLTDEVGRTRWAERAREFLKSRHNLHEVGPRFVQLLQAAARFRE
jgi:glycosyltransferase involved in cell wall biosynthesis